MKFTVQVAPEDCTGCSACVLTCPAEEKDANKQPTGRKAINMKLQEPLREQERENYKFFQSIRIPTASFSRRTPSRAASLCRHYSSIPVPAPDAVKRLI